jgi:hypothetical protein
MKSRSARTLLLAAVVLCSVAIGAAAIGTASEHYDVNSAGSIDVPDRTVTLNGQDFEIESVGYVTPGQTIEATTEAPDEKDYILYLYDNKVERVDFSQMTGDDSASFPTDDLDPGSYVLAVRADREYKVIQPVVVAGYEPTVDVSGEVTPGEPFTVEVDPDAEEYENAPDIDSITVVRTEDDEAVEEVEATPVDGSDTYEAELTAPDEEGEVRLLTTVLGEESIAFTSEQEILAIDDTTLTESSFEVTIDEDASTTEVSEQETVEIVADIENTGDFTGEQTIELTRDGDDIDDASVSLNGSESEVVTLTHDDDREEGEVSYTVSSSDSTDSLDVPVTESDETDGTDGGDTVEGPGSGSGTSDSDDGTTGGGATDGSDGGATDSGSVDDGSDTPETDEGSVTNGTDDGDQSENDSNTNSDEDSSDGSETTNTDATGSDGQDSESSSDADDDDEVIQPNEQESSSASAPLTGIPHFIAAVLVIGLLARKRRI